MTVTPETVVGSDFRIIAPLAKGDAGEIYVADQVSTGQRRALYVLMADLCADDGFVARFEDDVLIGKRIASDHAVDVVAAGIDFDIQQPWIAMEALTGETLAALVESRGPMLPKDARVLFTQIGHVLEAAHRAGIVHRGLKPENVFVTRLREVGGEFKVKLLGFGLARWIEEVRMPDEVAIPPRFLAPEQTGSQPVGPQTDVWAFGLLAFFVLTGRHYWKRAGGPEENANVLLREVLFEPLVPASRRAAEYGLERALPPSFDAWFVRCVTRDIGPRFANVAEAHTALDPLLASASLRAGSMPIIAGASPKRAPAPSVPQLAGTTVEHPKPARPDVGMDPKDVFAPVAASEPPEKARRSRRAVLMGMGLGAIGIGALGVGGYYAATAVFSDRRRKRARDDGEEPKRSKRGDRFDALPADVSGVYDITKGTYPANKETYKGLLTLTSDKNPNVYKILWSNGVEGIALQSDVVIGAAWGIGLFGVAIYDVDKGTLTGRFITNSDIEDVLGHVLRGPESLSGTYRVEDMRGTNMSVQIKPTGETFDVKYENRDDPSASFEGTGILVGKKLVVAFGATQLGGGVAAYTRDGKTYAGRWATRNTDALGRETLKKR